VVDGGGVVVVVGKASDGVVEVTPVS